MAVMAAGMRRAGVTGEVGLVSFFLEGQSVHIRPEGDRPAARPALEDGPQPRARHLPDGNAEAPEMGAQVVLGPGLGKGDFGMAVELAAPGHEGPAERVD